MFILNHIYFIHETKSAFPARGCTGETESLAVDHEESLEDLSRIADLYILNHDVAQI